MITPIVKPVNVKEYEFKQSKHDIAPRLPFSQIIVGPSGSGNGILLQSMILDIYRMSSLEYTFGLLQYLLTVIGHQLKNTFKII